MTKSIGVSLPLSENFLSDKSAITTTALFFFLVGGDDKRVGMCDVQIKKPATVNMILSLILDVLA